MSLGRVDFDRLCTEQPSHDPRLRHLDTLEVDQLVKLIHEQDELALQAVERAQTTIAEVTETVVEVLRAKGRLIYVGAGSSGRQVAADAAECPPTFGTSPSQVVAVVAGGTRALSRAIEGAEDSRREGRGAMARLAVEARDVVFGVTASGVTPFVLAALAEGQRRGAHTVLLTCARPQRVQGQADQTICLDVGAETVAGSTRMKAGLATHAVLHTVTTAAMIRLGKVYDNLMVDLVPTSRKLRRRALRIVSTLTGLSPAAAARLLKKAQDHPKVAVVMHHRQVDQHEAQRLLAQAKGQLRHVIGEIGHHAP
jgi:N-acetylmuramic acid 6-phosphate etherase